jgi:hypothetical protein
LLARVRSAGRVYVSPKLPRFDMATLPIEAPGALPRT